MSEKHKYEVSFSFLHQDESLAQRLNDLLQDRISTFIYTERQLELAGKDGEILLKEAFGSEARIVVILYRKEWGTTPWTRIEQDAIRNRAFDHGYDFCLLIPLDSPPTSPEWYPKNRIWIGLQRWGVDGAAAVIEQRVQEGGGETREESLSERKARLERQVLAAEKRKAFLESENASAPASSEAQNVLNQIEQLASSLSTKEFGLQTKSDYNEIKITSYGFILLAYWEKPYANTITNSRFCLRLLELNRREHDSRNFSELSNLSFLFSIDESEQYGWRAIWGDKKFFTSKELAEFTIRIILDKVAEFRKGEAT